MCTPDNPPAAQNSTPNATPNATGVTAVNDGYDGARNASSVVGTATNALSLRNTAISSALNQVDDAALVSGLRSYNNVLGAAGAAANTVNAGLNNNQTTTAGKVANVTLTGGLSVAAMRANPVVGAVDLATGGEVSNTMNTGINATVGMAEAAITGDTSGVESLHQENLRGENGFVVQQSAEAGDYWAKRGVRGTLSDFAYELTD